MNSFINLFNPWIMFGFAAQFVFFMRFVVQWFVSEREKKSVVPDTFWYLSIVGTIMILIYSVYQKDIVFVTASALNMLIYLRNIVLIKKQNNSPAVR